MFPIEDCYRLGSIAKLHSYKGEVTIYLDVDDPQEFRNLESVYVEYDNKLIPFFLERIQVRPNKFAVVKFEDIDSERQAQKLVKCGLYLPLETLPELEGIEFYYHEIEGFSVQEKEHGYIGVVKQVLDLNNNPMLEIDFNGLEILLPKQDQFILNVDRENKTIHVTAPEGLIDMYLNNDSEEE